MNETMNNENTTVHKTNIIDLWDVEYDICDTPLSFYTKFRLLVSQNLKRAGYQDSDCDNPLNQDEIISPTFQEVIILWALEKIHPELPKKVKQQFSEKLKAGDSVNFLLTEILQFLSSKEITDYIQNKPKQTNICRICEKQIVTKSDPETKTVIENGDDLYIKSEEIEALVDINRYSVKGEKDAAYFYIADNSNDDDYLESLDKKEDDLHSVESNFDPNSDWEDSIENDNVIDKIVKSKLELKNIKCDICGQTCKGEERLNQHVQKKHQKVFECKTCGDIFNDSKTFKTHRVEVHMQKYVKPVPVVCDTCGRSCAGKRRLREHIQRRHNRTYTCKICELVLNSSEELKAHRLKSHKPARKPEMCPHCGKIIHSKLKRHILTHFSNICCKLCSEKFMTPEELETHMKKHEENPNYCKRKQRTIQCETCKRTFADAEEYGLHVCKHFSCETCGLKFMIKRNLETHKRFHAGETVFTCDLCESIFMNRKALYCHKRSAHDPDKKKYKCDICEKAFLNPCHLERHKISHSTIRAQKCNTCGKTFKHKAALDSHIRSHTEERSFPCVGCDMTFKTLMDMKKHREMNKCDYVKMES